MMISRDVTEGLKQGVLVGAVILAVVVPMRHHLLPQRATAPVVDPSAVSAPQPPAVVAPAAPQWDRDHTFPRELFTKLGEHTALRARSVG